MKSRLLQEWQLKADADVLLPLPSLPMVSKNMINLCGGMLGNRFVLHIPPCNYCAPHWLPAPARTLLLTSRLPIALCAKRKIRKACEGGRKYYLTTSKIDSNCQSLLMSLVIFPDVPVAILPQSAVCNFA